jgi:parallel beta-helix repeat protein
LNVYSGNGSALSGGPPLPPGVSNNFGIGLVGTSKNNLIEENSIGGNLNGIYIGSATQGGNVIRRNICAGNPPVQVSKTFGPSVGADIQEVSTPGGNTFEENVCVTYVGRTAPAPCPNIRFKNDDDDEPAADKPAE